MKGGGQGEHLAPDELGICECFHLAECGQSAGTRSTAPSRSASSLLLREDMVFGGTVHKPFSGLQTAPPAVMGWGPSHEAPLPPA